MIHNFFTVIDTNEGEITSIGPKTENGEMIIEIFFPF